MNIFFEFYKVVEKLQKQKIDYAVIGGVAMAFHAYARFTKDVDILIKPEDYQGLRDVLVEAGYNGGDKPWAFKTGLILHRFWKIEGEDEMIMDVLVCATAKQESVIDNAVEAYAESTGTIRVARAEDLIWLKSQRNSAIDKADIEKLKENENSPLN